MANREGGQVDTLPVQIYGWDGTIIRTVKIDTSGNLVVAQKEAVLIAPIPAGSNIIGKVGLEAGANEIGKVKITDGTEEVNVDANGNLHVTEKGNQKSAFDELLIAELTPKIQLDFPYNINTDIINTTLVASGTVTQSNSKAVVSSGAAINSSAAMLSKRVLKYDPGQGGLVRFTAIFTTGIAGSQQEIGLGDSTDGFFFGYDGATFSLE